ncbi:hypothetical protein AAE478_008258 [Parahypoxylon ruwenzoriense]
MHLCATCSGLDMFGALRRAQAGQLNDDNNDDDGRARVQGWHSKARDVFDSASDCELCRLIVRGWEHWRSCVVSQAISDAMFDPKNPPQDLYANVKDINVYYEAAVEVGITKREHFAGEGREWSFILTVACRPTGTVGSWEVHDGLEAEFRIVRPAGEGDSGVDEEGVGVGVAVGEDPMSISAVDTVRAWLETCLAKHESCSPKTQTATLPSRFLDVNDGDHDEQIFLRDDDGAGADRRYVALSHCWGTAQQFCTMTATLESHKQGVPVDKLPSTFRDAVKVVRALGLRYLWIDSLCIIQDDIEDWRRESEKMAEIYRQAYFVLAATRSTSDQEGFLGLRARPDRVELTARNGTHLILELLPPSLLQETHNTHPIDIEPLSRRAWCLQERYLSRRILHYGSRQMYWECGQIRAAEDGDFNPVVGDQLWRIQRSAAVATTVFNGIDEEEGEGEGEGEFNYAGWYKMVEDYTSRDITKDSDRLPALLGLDRALGAQTGDRNLIGLWFKGLLEGLTWRAASPNHTLARPPNYPAPSWSWVAVKGPVDFPVYTWYERRAAWKGSRANFEPLGQWLGHTFAMRDVVPYGRLIDGELRLSAPVVPVRRSGPRAEKPPESGSAFGTAPERAPVADRSFCFEACDAEGTARDFLIDGAFDVQEEEDAVDAGKLHLVFLTRLPFVLEFDFLEHRFGLVVEWNGGTEKYRRVGFVDGCLLSGEPQGRAGRLVSGVCEEGEEEEGSPIVWAFPREREDGDMDADDLNGLAPDPLKLSKEMVVLV